jgi:hypothetical protein
MNEGAESKNSLFNPGKAQWLREQGGTQLTSDELALLLAMAQLETELGRRLSEEEQETIESVASQLEGIEPNSIVEAVKHMVQTQADPARKTTWPELKHHKRT